MAETSKKAKAETKTKEKEIKDTVEVPVSVDSKDEVKESGPVTETEVKPEAKAGKRSAKALKETEEKIQKEERKKASAATKTAEKPKTTQKPPRSQVERKGKKYRELAHQIDKAKFYGVDDALSLAIETNPAKFDSTVELHVRLGVDPKQSDQNIRDNIILPSGTGKTIKVAVFGDDDDITKAKKAGADLALGDELLQQLDKGVTDFDILITTPAAMPKLSKYARILGPKGLMPNPKNSTVTSDVAKAIREAKAGKVEYRIDSTGIVHLGIGKVSFGKDKLLLNAQTVLDSIKSNKPSSLKGNYIISIFVTTTMGPSIPVDRNF